MGFPFESQRICPVTISVWPVFILVSMAYCFIYFYFLSGSVLRFPFSYTCPRLSHFCCYLYSQCHCNHHLSPLIGKATWQYLYALFSHTYTHVRVSELLGSRGHFCYSVCTLTLLLCVHTLIYSVYLPGSGGAASGLHFSVLLESASGCRQHGDDPHCHHVGHFFSGLACDGKEGF